MKPNAITSRKSMFLLFIFSVTVVLLLASIAGQFYNYYFLQNLKALTPGIINWYNPFWEEFFVQLLICIAVWISAYLIYKYTRKFRIAGILISVFGTLTFCGFVLQVICINEFYDEYYVGGYNADFEWVFTHVFLVINVIFSICASVLMILGIRNLKSTITKDSQSNEYIFEVTQYIGIISGLIGMAFTFYAFHYLSRYSHKLSPAYINWIFVCCLIFIFPYLSMILFWIAKLAFKKDKSVYDEKQKTDLAHAGLYTWLISIPIMSIFLIINLDHIRFVLGLLAFPIYIFTTLFIFSSSVLINYKRI